MNDIDKMPGKCHDCAYWESCAYHPYFCPIELSDNSIEVFVKGKRDTISRQEAIQAAKHAWAKGLEPSQYIEILPPAQPKRKTGTWIDHTEDGYVECPFCGSATNCDGNIEELHYCFSCGAELEHDYDYERASDMRDYCEHYELTYNPEDGSM